MNNPTNQKTNNISQKQTIELKISLFACILYFLLVLLNSLTLLALVKLVVASLDFLS